MPFSELFRVTTWDPVAPCRLPAGRNQNKPTFVNTKAHSHFLRVRFLSRGKSFFLRRGLGKCHPLSISQAARGGGKVYKQFFVFGRRRLHASFVFSISGLRFRLLRAASPSKRESVSLEAAAVTDTGCYDMGCVWTTQSDVAKS